MLRARVEDASQNVVEIVCHGEDGLEKVPRPRVGPISRVLVRCLLPWVAAAGEVKQDDS
jgi:hypothetical protein